MKRTTDEHTGISPFDKFTKAMDGLMSVPHSELKQGLVPPDYTLPLIFSRYFDSIVAEIRSQRTYPPSLALARLGFLRKPLAPYF